MPCRATAATIACEWGRQTSSRTRQGPGNPRRISQLIRILPLPRARERVRVRACPRACICACACVHVRACACMRVRASERRQALSSSAVNFSFFTSGVRWLCQRSRHCLPIRPGSASEMRDQEPGPCCVTCARHGQGSARQEVEARGKRRETDRRVAKVCRAC